MKMQKWKKVISIIFFVLSLMSVVSMILSVIFKLTYTSNDSEPLAVYMDKSITTMFIIVSVMGTISSVLGCISFAKTSGPIIPNKKIQIQKNILYSLCIVSVVVFCLLLCLLFGLLKTMQIDIDVVSQILFFGWLVLSLTSLILLAAIKLQIRKSNRINAIREEA